MLSNVTVYFLCLSYLAFTCHAVRPEEGVWNLVVNPDYDIFSFSSSLFSGSEISIKVNCDDTYNVTVAWILTEPLCWNEYLNLGHGLIKQLQLKYIENNVYSNNTYKKFDEHDYSCAKEIVLDDLSSQPTTKSNLVPMHKRGRFRVYTVPKDGMYLLTVTVTTKNSQMPSSDTILENFTANLQITMCGPQGYLSASNWPLLPFYEIMCFVYICFGITWLILLFLQWRDLLQIQFWIGAVILLGMVEKAAFYAEYYELNSTGRLNSIYGVMTMAEVISCLKRTLARILVIIVSLGFGIVKPRLGPLLPKVLGVSFMYLAMSLLESYFRLSTNMSTEMLLVELPLAILDSGIVCWIFSALTQTTRALRLRRNAVKLQLYTHFTNVLGFTVITSTLFMLYSIKTQRLANCVGNWQEQWLDDAFWHIEFSIILLVIMILWRPTNNNQRYAFTPLLDAPDDDRDETELFIKETYNEVKMRTTANTSNQNSHVTPYKDYPISNSSSTKSQAQIDDDLKWVEENIPGSLYETTVPILDYSEDDHNTAIERSKLQ
ncbi:transmembrane protein 87B [Daktulosphaira vitifoliae]|uniref:transmembrane protein 87B n=1 Tax=Daktulosphaira vitifoliae TaxID=58002 RepID=UPI0021A9BA31|nr:transmembrane protein 87B [Daktulosphaira vitifoliae]